MMLLSDYIWGVIDFVPDTDFPDIRNRTAIHSSNGSCMIIPREGDKVRFYLQMSDKDVIDPETGRVDKVKVTAEKLIDVCTGLIVSRLLHNPSRNRLLAKHSTHTQSTNPKKWTGVQSTSVRIRYCYHLD